MLTLASWVLLLLLLLLIAVSVRVFQGKKSLIEWSPTRVGASFIVSL